MNCYRFILICENSLLARHDEYTRYHRKEVYRKNLNYDRERTVRYTYHAPNHSGQKSHQGARYQSLNYASSDLHLPKPALSPVAFCAFSQAGFTLLAWRSSFREESHAPNAYQNQADHKAFLKRRFVRDT